MESKRLGLCQKSMFVVPNHLTLQWANEFLRLYPGAKLLVATKKDFETARRKKFCARIATGDYDAVIIGHSQFEKIPISSERQERLLQEQIDDIEDAIAELKYSKGETFTIKQMEKTRKTLQTRLDKLMAEEKKDDVVTFEQLGVDRLFVDESHAFKNLFLYTKMRNVAGLSTSEAQKSSDMFMKCRYMDEITGGRGIVFATGTPVSNSMSELYTVMRYLQPKRQKLMTIPCTAQTDKKLKYVRYADDFLIAVKGNREDCQWIKSKLAEFIGDTLKMELSEDKTLITHSSKCARFLGYDVRVRRSGKIKRGGPGHVKMRTLNGGVELLVPLNDKIRQFVFTKGVAIQKEDGSMFPVHRKYLVGLTDLEIVSVYNAELRGICNYYGMASNFCKLHYFSYLMEYSCLKTLASKHKTSLSKIIDKFNDGTGKWGVPYETKLGSKRRYFANYADCKGKGSATDYISNAAVVYGYAVNTLENRLKAKVCELCGTTESDHYEVHHINKLKNLKGKERWEIAMIAKHRKTLVVCRDCHRSIIHKK